MAVYTALPPEVFERVAEAFGLGAVREVTPIPRAPSTPTTAWRRRAARYFVRHTTVRSADDLRFESALLAHLAAYHFPGPVQLTTRDGATFLEAGGWPCQRLQWLPGEELRHPALTADHLERLGAELGKLHRDHAVLRRHAGESLRRRRQVRGWLAGAGGAPGRGAGGRGA